MARQFFPTSEAEFIPPFLADRVAAMEVKVYGKDHDTMAKKLFEMVIEWNEENSEEKEEPKKEQKEKPKVESLMKAQVKVGDLSCDGPCGKSYHPNTMHSMGRCDHYICSFCCDLVGNLDGSKGCSNFECVRRNFLGWMSERNAVQAYNDTIREKYKAKRDKFAAGEIEMPNGRLGQPSQCNLLLMAPASSIYEPVAEKMVNEEAEKNDVRRVHASIFNQGERLCSVKGKFHVREKLKNIAVQLAKKGHPEFSDQKGIRIFTSRHNDERLHPLSLEQLELRLGKMVKPNKELHLVVDLTGDAGKKQ